MGEYNKAAIIKYARREKGMTQEELAEGICDPVTLSRYENGQIDPTEERFVRLMQKLGVKSDRYIFPIECESAEIEKIMVEILYFIEKKDWKSAEKFLNIIKNKYSISMEYCENRQYCKRIEVIINYNKGIIDEEEAIKELEEALSYTYDGDIWNEFIASRIYRETEILILFNMATLYSLIGDEKKALSVYQNLDNYFMRSDILNNNKPRYLVYVGYTNLLGKIKEYDKAIRICWREIKWLKRNNKVNYLYNFYYNIGWCMKKKIDEGLEEKKGILIAKIYVWVSYWLCYKYPENENNLRKIEKFYRELCREDMGTERII